MRNAYALLGLLFLILIVGAFFIAKDNQETMTDLTLTSTAFESNGKIPSVYTCDGENTNPALSISGVPDEAQSLVLIMDDPDAIKPAGHVWDHWVVWNIPPSTSEIVKGEEPQGVHGKGSGGGSDYSGPCPPDAEHLYFFKLYALDALLDLSEGASKAEVEKAMEGHILLQTELTGRYKRE